MHQGRPYGLHVIGGALSSNDTSFIDASAKRVSNLKDLSGLDSLKLVYDLPDGGSCIIQDTGGNFRVIAYKPVHKEPPTFDGLARTYIPMLFSGAIAGNAILRTDQGLPLNLSLQTRKRVLGYINGYAPKNVRLMRFACKYGAMFQEFMPEQPIENAVYTQYAHQRPTWYSGAMAEVMQIVGGYGKQILSKLPDDPIERSAFRLPSSYQHAVDKELASVRLPCYTGLPNEDGEFQCDYKFFNTNTISFDSSNKPWLLRVDRSGVWAMPLPIITATATDSFRAYVDGMGDSEIIAILDRFGAMPSGETFPISTSAFQAWRRAGVIIKVCDTKDFYKNLPYSSAMGWSANTTGTELVNTCYSIDDVTGKITAFAYKARLRLGAAVNHGWIKARTGEALIDMGHINKYLQSIFELITENTPTNLAIKYKINRASLIDIGARARLYSGQSEVDYWNNLELDPIASHTGTLTKINEGIYLGGQNVKVPEPMLGGCISLPTPVPTAANFKGVKDTIVLAYYIGDQLKTVKLFEDDRPQTTKQINTFADFMYVGNWKKREVYGDSHISGNIYTSDVDDREIVAPRELEVNVVGKDLGYTGATLQMDFYFWRTGTLYREKFYSNKTTTTNTYGRRIELAAAIPFLCRNILIYAKTESTGSQTFEENLFRGSVIDPNKYRAWSDNESLLMYGTPEVKNGTPHPTDGKPVYAETREYSPNDGNAWADSGDWVGGLPADITPLLYDYSKVVWAFKTSFPVPPIKEYTHISSNNGYSEKTLSCQVYSTMDKVRGGYHNDFYYYRTPDENMTTLDENACKVLFGSNEYANISEVAETGNRKQWGESSLVDNKSAHHFIGVINE